MNMKPRFMIFKHFYMKPGIANTHSNHPIHPAFSLISFSRLLTAGIVWICMAACGSAVKQEVPVDKKAELQQLKEQQAALNDRIITLEEELARTDTTVANEMNARLVELTPVALQDFTHYIELQGKVETVNMVYVAPRGAGGQVKEIYVKQGDRVRKGQLLMKLDNAVTQQQIQQVQTQLVLAETLYERRRNLWDKEIGTEVELLQAKNNVDNLKQQIALLEEQSGMSNIYAQISGVADMVNIRVGEYFSPQTASTLGIRIVNTDNLKVVAQVPENYLHKVDEGANVQVYLPGIDKTIASKITVKGKTIDPNTRSFYIEIRVPASRDLRPNQLTMVKIQDYAADNAVTIPVNTLQNDDKGKYVMVAVEENGRKIARKRPVEVGELYENNLEVKSGLTEGEMLVTEGFQGLYEGQQLRTKANI